MVAVAVTTTTKGAAGASSRTVRAGSKPRCLAAAGFLFGKVAGERRSRGSGADLGGLAIAVLSHYAATRL
jgi:hypothetical protein